MKATELKLAEMDAKVRFTQPLLGLHNPAEPDVYFPFTASIVNQGWRGSQYHYESRLQRLKNVRQRYLMIGHVPGDDGPTHYSYDDAERQRIIMASFDANRRYLILYEHPDWIMKYPELRILLNFVERQTADLMPDVKVERLAREMTERNLDQPLTGEIRLHGSDYDD